MQLGFELAMMGMGTVFIFLILLIYFTSLMSRLVGVYEQKANPDSQLQTTPKTVTATIPIPIPADVLATVISSAIKQYKQASQ